MSKLGPLTPTPYGINPLTGQHPNVNISSITKSMGSLSFSNEKKKKGISFANTYGGPLGSGVFIPHRNNAKGGKRKTYKKSKKHIRKTRR
jgi:hypothetical protein